MSDETLDTGLPAEGEGNLPAGEQPAAEYVTRADFDERIEYLLRELKDMPRRVSQSLADRDKSRDVERVKARMSAFDEEVRLARQAGVELSDAEIAAMRKQIALEAARSAPRDDDFDNPRSQASTAGVSDEQVEQVNVKYAQLVARYNFTLNANDREYVEPSRFADPNDWLREVEQAMSRKQRRITGQPQAPTGQSPPVPSPGAQGNPARVPGLVSGGNAGARIDQVTRELEILQQNPTMNMKRRKELSTELKQLLAAK